MEISAITIKRSKLSDVTSEETKAMFDKIIKNIETIMNILESISDEIFISFNGGKDCLATLIVIMYYFYCKEENKDYKSFSSYKDFCELNSNSKSKAFKNFKRITLVFFLIPDTFKEEIFYVYDIVNMYELNIKVINSSYISGMYYMTKCSNLQYIFMGLRKSDLNEKDLVLHSDLMQRSDGNYPSFTRVYPIFNLKFQEVWMLILQSNIPYLCLYDQGFTSLGRKSKTKQNDHLKIEKNINFENKFLPAYMLTDEEFERTSRK